MLFSFNVSTRWKAWKSSEEKRARCEINIVEYKNDVKDETLAGCRCFISLMIFSFSTFSSALKIKFLKRIFHFSSAVEFRTEYVWSISWIFRLMNYDTTSNLSLVKWSCSRLETSRNCEDGEWFGSFTFKLEFCSWYSRVLRFKEKCCCL